MSDWLHENVPWIFSGAGVTIIAGLYALIKNRGWFSNSLKQLQFRPVIEWTNIPNSGEGSAFFQFGFRLTNIQSAPVIITAIHSRSKLSALQECFPLVQMFFPTTSAVIFPTVLGGHATHDLIAVIHVADNSARSFHWDLGLYAPGKNQSAITIDVFRESAEEFEVAFEWFGVRTNMGRMRAPLGQKQIDIKFRKKLNSANYTIETTFAPDPINAPDGVREQQDDCRS